MPVRWPLSYSRAASVWRMLCARPALAAGLPCMIRDDEASCVLCAYWISAWPVGHDRSHPVRAHAATQRHQHV